MEPQTFKTRSGRITITDQSVIFEQTTIGNKRRDSVARSEIIGVNVVTRLPDMFGLPIGSAELAIHHRGGDLKIFPVQHKVARQVQIALGF